MVGTPDVNTTRSSEEKQHTDSAIHTKYFSLENCRAMPCPHFTRGIKPLPQHSACPGDALLPHHQIVTLGPIGVLLDKVENNLFPVVKKLL